MVNTNEMVENIVGYTKEVILGILEDENRYDLHEILNEILDSQITSLSTMECAEIILDVGEGAISDEGVIDKSSFSSHAMTGAYACLETLVFENDEIFFFAQYSNESLNEEDLDEVLEALGGSDSLEDEEDKQIRQEGYEDL